jgi:hypothetical protein
VKRTTYGRLEEVLWASGGALVRSGGIITASEFRFSVHTAGGREAARRPSKSVHVNKCVRVERNVNVQRKRSRQ